MFLNPFKGKHVLITGGASGLGLAMAKAFAHQHAHVAIIDHDKAQLDEAQHEIEGLGMGIRCLTFACDIGQGHVLRDYISMIHYEFGALDGIIACPSPIPSGSFNDFDHTEIDLHIDSHVKGALHALRAGTPILAKNGAIGGFIGLVVPAGREYSANAAAAQAAVTAVAHSIYAECAQERVRVHLLMPPTIIHPFKRSFIAKKFLRGIANNRRTVAYGLSTRIRRFTLRHFPLLWRLFFSSPKHTVSAEIHEEEELEIQEQESPISSEPRTQEASASPPPAPEPDEEEIVEKTPSVQETPAQVRRTDASGASNGYTMFNQTLLKRIIVSMELEDVKPFLHSITKHVPSLDIHITDIITGIAMLDTEEESSWEFEFPYDDTHIPFQIDVSLRSQEVITMYFYTTPKLALVIDQEFGRSLSA